MPIIRSQGFSLPQEKLARSNYLSNRSLTMSLSLKDQLLTLYLTPLLEKHQRNQFISWDDLHHAKHQADTYLQQHQQQEDVQDASQELLALHKSQIALYREQAVATLTEWSQSWTLPEPVAGESQSEYSQRCLARAFDERPFWKLGTGLLQKILSPVIHDRAKSAFVKPQQPEATIEPENTPAIKTVTTRDEESEGEVEEDGEDGEDGEVVGDEDGPAEIDEDDEDGEVDEDEPSQTASETNKSLLASKKTVANKKRNVPVKKAVQRKKRPAAAVEKANQPKRLGGAKKRGRGGAAAGAAPSNTSNK